MLLVAVGSCAAHAQEARRGWLTGAGLMLAGGGAVLLGVGAYDAAQADAASRTVGAYYANGAAPTAGEASTVRWLQERSESMGSLGLGLLISGAAAVAVGIGLVLLDGWLGSAEVSVSLQPARAAVLVSGTF